MQSLGKMAAMGMAGLLLFDLTLAVGVTSMSTVSDTAMMSIHSNGCKKTSAKSDSDSGNSLIDKYIAEAEKMANDNKIGYSQTKRKLNPDVDCSSFVYYALTKGGIKNLGDSPFNTSSMDDPMTKAGFTKNDFDGSADKLQKGDVVWRSGHTEIYIGDNKTVGAHEDTDGKDGDSKGDEVSEVSLDYGGGKYTVYYRLSDSSASSSSDSGSTSSTSDFKTNDVAIKIAKAFASAGYSKASTAGVIGNVSWESSFDSNSGDGGSAYGLGQWDPRSKIRTWMDNNGMKDTPDSDEDGQIKMLVATAKSSFTNLYLSKTKSEITVKNNSLYDTWHEATTPEDAAVAWMAGWEKPDWASRHEDERKQVAKDYYEKGLNGISFNGKSNDSDDSDDAQCCTEDSDSSSDDKNSSTVANASVSSSDSTTLTGNSKEFVDKTVDAAYKVGKKYKIPYEVILGQSAQETGWGTSSLAKEHNAYFGIRPTSGSQGTVETGSNGSFVAYNSVEESFEDYGLFIHENSRYAKALQYPNNPQKYLHEVAYAGYCTDDGAGHTGEAAYPIYEQRVWDLTKSIAAYIKSTGKYPASSEMSYSDSDSDDGNTVCPASSEDEGTAKNGEIGGAPTNTKNFGWMCSGKAKVCKDGDTGPSFLWSNGADYQCYWYWLMRSYMVFGTMENPRTWFGGDLYDELQGRQGWTTSKTPKPGAGVSFKDGTGAITHVAFVEKVETDSSGKWKIFISEGNADGSGSWNSYATRWVDDKWAGWIQGFFWRTEWNL